jgi:hypothetical protein
MNTTTRTEAEQPNMTEEITSGFTSDETPESSSVFVTDLNYYDAKCNFKDLTEAEEEELLKQLQREFPTIVSFKIDPPQIFIDADSDLALPADIAGLEPEVIKPGCWYPFQNLFMGERGGGPIPNDIPDEIAQDLRRFHFAKSATRRFLLDYIPEADWVSSFPEQLFVEMEYISHEDFRTLLPKLPPRIGGLDVGYMRGAVIPTRRVGARPVLHRVEPEGDSHISENNEEVHSAPELESIGQPESQ